MHLLKQVLQAALWAVSTVFSWGLALLILFEEWGWEPLQRALARIGQLPGLRWIERRIQTLPAYAALAFLLLPSVLLLPIKLVALWLIGQGHLLLGSLVIIAAKLGGTALVARIFTLTRPTLLQLPWFARLYARWSDWKLRLLTQVRASWAWRKAHQIKLHTQLRLAAWKARWWG